MRLVDLHCHLDLYPDPAKAVAEAASARVYTLTVTTTPRAWPRNRILTESTDCVRAALGLHPQLVAEHSKEVALWEQYLPEARYIGEVGLDAGPRYFRSLDLQKQVFERILRMCAMTGDKILSVHSVRATKAVLDLIEATLPPKRGTVVLHWFTGQPSEIRRAVELGCYFSVNAAMLATERGRAVIVTIPEDRLLTETDGPFTSTDGRPSRPSDVQGLLQDLARVLSTSASDLSMRVLTNLKRLVTAAGDPLAFKIVE
ncbi:MAG: Qat anti-phage system TatD family nuclease QatD [Bryobacteraceae bacterium]